MIWYTEINGTKITITGSNDEYEMWLSNRKKDIIKKNIKDLKYNNYEPVENSI